MTENRRGVVASSLRTAGNAVLYGAEKYWHFLKVATRFCFVALVLGVSLIMFGAGRDSGAWMVPAGTLLSVLSVAVWLLSMIIILMIAQTLAQKSQAFGNILRMIGVIVTVGAFSTFYFAISGIHAYPKLLAVGLGLLALVMLMTMVGDGPRELSTLNVRLAFVFTFLTVVLVYMHLPYQVQSKLFFQTQSLAGLTPNRVPYTLEGLKKGEPEFFKKVPNSKGQPEPAIWYYLDTDDDTYNLFDGPGTYTNNSDPLLPATRNLRQTIIKHEEKKLAEAQKLVDNQKPVEAPVVQPPAEPAKPEVGERKTLSKEDEAKMIKSMKEEQDRVNRDGMDFWVHTEVTTIYDQPKDSLVVRPLEPFGFKVWLIEQEGALIVLKISKIEETLDGKGYTLMLQPDEIIVGSKRFNDLAQYVERPIELVVHKKDYYDRNKAVPGAIGSVLEINSHRKKFELLIGDRLPPIHILPKPK